MEQRGIKHLFSLEKLANLLMIAAVFLALLLCNYYKPFYTSIIEYKITAEITPKYVVNDVLMCIFFMITGMELKKEFVSGILKNKTFIYISCFATLGGMIIPALIFFMINYNDTQALIGSVIPCATDITFAIFVFNLFARTVFAHTTKIFLLSIAILDDVGSIFLIALFFSTHIQYQFLPILIVTCVVLLISVKNHYQNLIFYCAIFVALWISCKMTGIHTTIAGVIVGISLPYKGNKIPSMLSSVYKILNPIVLLVILPIFIFFSCEIEIQEITWKCLLHSKKTLGVFLGLFLGKQIGITLFSLLYNTIFHRNKLFTIPIKDIYITSILASIGFTVSLFITNLAFVQDKQALVEIKSGLIISAIASILLSIVFTVIVKVFINKPNNVLP